MPARSRGRRPIKTSSAPYIRPTVEEYEGETDSDRVTHRKGTARPKVSHSDSDEDDPYDTDGVDTSNMGNRPPIQDQREHGHYPGFRPLNRRDESSAKAEFSQREYKLYDSWPRPNHSRPVDGFTRPGPKVTSWRHRKSSDGDDKSIRKSRWMTSSDSTSERRRPYPSKPAFLRRPLDPAFVSRYRNDSSIPDRYDLGNMPDPRDYFLKEESFRREESQKQIRDLRSQVATLEAFVKKRSEDVAVDGGGVNVGVSKPGLSTSHHVQRNPERVAADFRSLQESGLKAGISAWAQTSAVISDLDSTSRLFCAHQIDHWEDEKGIEKNLLLVDEGPPKDSNAVDSVSIRWLHVQRETLSFSVLENIITTCPHIPIDLIQVALRALEDAKSTFSRSHGDCNMLEHGAVRHIGRFNGLGDQAIGGQTEPVVVMVSPYLSLEELHLGPRDEREFGPQTLLQILHGYDVGAERERRQTVLRSSTAEMQTLHVRQTWMVLLGSDILITMASEPAETLWDGPLEIGSGNSSHGDATTMRFKDEKGQTFNVNVMLGPECTYVDILRHCVLLSTGTVEKLHEYYLSSIDGDLLSPTDVIERLSSEKPDINTYVLVSRASRDIIPTSQMLALPELESHNTRTNYSSDEYLSGPRLIEGPRRSSVEFDESESEGTRSEAKGKRFKYKKGKGSTRRLNEKQSGEFSRRAPSTTSPWSTPPIPVARFLMPSRLRPPREAGVSSRSDHKSQQPPAQRDYFPYLPEKFWLQSYPTVESFPTKLTPLTSQALRQIEGSVEGGGEGFHPHTSVNSNSSSSREESSKVDSWSSEGSKSPASAAATGSHLHSDYDGLDEASDSENNVPGSTGRYSASDRAPRSEPKVQFMDKNAGERDWPLVLRKEMSVQDQHSTQAVKVPFFQWSLPSAPGKSTKVPGATITILGRIDKFLKRQLKGSLYRRASRFSEKEVFKRQRPYMPEGYATVYAESCLSPETLAASTSGTSQTAHSSDAFDLQDEGHPRLDKEGTCALTSVHEQQRMIQLLETFSRLFEAFVPKEKKSTTHPALLMYWGSLDCIFTQMRWQRLTYPSKLPSTPEAVAFSIRNFDPPEPKTHPKTQSQCWAACRECSSSRIYETAALAIEHIHDAHPHVGCGKGSTRPNDDPCFAWVSGVSRPGTEVPTDETAKGLRSIDDFIENMGLLSESVTELHSLVAQVSRSPPSIPTSLSSRLTLPSSLVEAFGRIVEMTILRSQLLSLQSRDLDDRDASAVGRRSGRHATKQKSIMNWEASALRAAKTCLLDARKDIILLGSPIQAISGFEVEQLGVDFLALKLIEAMQNRALKLGLSSNKSTRRPDYLDLYQSHFPRLRFQAYRRPQKRLFRDICDMEEELNALQSLIDAQDKVISDLISVTSPSSSDNQPESRERMFKFEKRSAQSQRENLQRYKKEIQLLLDKCGALKHHVKQAIEILEEGHGKAIRVFTIVTLFFLPLSFVSSFLGMNTSDVSNTKWDQSIFWATAVPVTAAVVASALIYGYKGDVFADWFSERMDHGRGREKAEDQGQRYGKVHRLREKLPGPVGGISRRPTTDSFGI